MNRDTFADAISATNISQGQYPVLYTNTTGLKDETKAYLNQKNFEEIIVLGGSASIQDNVLNDIAKATPGTTIKRIDSKNRYSLNSETVLSHYQAEDHVVIASGEVFADALYGISYATKQQAPMVLVRPNAIDQETLATLKKLGVQKATIIGGPTTLSDQRVLEIENLGIATTRISGSNRYKGSAAVAEAAYPQPDHAIVVNGEVFSDALVSAPLAQKYNAPILLVKNKVLEPEVATYFKKYGEGMDTVHILGGYLSVTPEHLQYISEYLYPEEVQEVVLIAQVGQAYGDLSYVNERSFNLSEIARETAEIRYQSAQNPATAYYTLAKNRAGIYQNIPIPFTKEIAQKFNAGELFDVRIFNEEMLKLLNKDRAAKGISPLRMGELDLQNGTYTRASEQVQLGTIESNNKPHYRPDGSTFETAFEGNVTAENLLAMTYLANPYHVLSERNMAEMFYEEWKGSASHFYNMMLPDIQETYVVVQMTAPDITTVYENPWFNMNQLFVAQAFR